MIPPAPSVTFNTVATPSQSSILVAQVTVRAKTQSVEVTSRDGADHNDMFAQSQMELRGPPITRSDLLARQTMANRFSLTPYLCDLLAFGESEDASPPDRAGRHAIALPPRNIRNKLKEISVLSLVYTPIAVFAE